MSHQPHLSSSSNAEGDSLNSPSVRLSIYSILLCHLYIADAASVSKVGSLPWGSRMSPSSALPSGDSSRATLP